MRALDTDHKYINMHYMLEWWFKEVVQKKLKEYSGLVVYADEITINTHFLGFTHYFARYRYGECRVKRFI